MFLDDQMSVLLNLRSIFPVNGAPAEFGDGSMISLPSFKVYGQPCTLLLLKKGSRSIKDLATISQRWIVSFLQLFVDLVQVLTVSVLEDSDENSNAHLVTFFQFATGFEGDGFDTTKVGFKQEAIAVR